MKTKRLVAFLVILAMLFSFAPAALAQAQEAAPTGTEAPAGNTEPTGTQTPDASPTPEGPGEATATPGEPLPDTSPSAPGSASPSPSPSANPSPTGSAGPSPSPDVSPSATGSASPSAGGSASPSPEPDAANGGISPLFIDPDDADPGDTAPHYHKLCGAAEGAACAHTGAQHGDTIEFESIENYRDKNTGAFVFPHDANVYVPKETNLGNKQSVIPAGVTVTLCLDGNTLIESPQTATRYMEGFAIEDGGTLNLCDCKGTGSLVNFNDNDFTVYDTGTLNMYGGTLERSDRTPPIRLIGTFNMYGGAITGNYGRCAVEVTNGRINLYGGVIDGNFTNDISSYKSNVELSPGAVIKIPDKLYPGTRVGVSYSDSGAVDKQDVRITNGYGDHNIEDPSVFFFSDNPAFQISMKDGDAYLARIPGEPHPPHPSCGENPCPHGGVHQNITDWEDLNHTNKPVGGHNYYLSADYVLPSNFDITGGKETTLCLNGHKLSIAHQHDTYDSVILLEHGTLRICDCQGGGEISGGRGSDFNFYGGNIYVNGGNLELYGGTISGGRADRAGGGVYVENGSFKMYGGAVSENHGDQYGGGVYVENGTFDLYGGSITNNAGTGVHVDSGGVFTMTGGEISGNSGDQDYELACGGGVQVDNGGTFNMKGGTISGNTGKFGGGVEVRSSSQYRPTSGVFNLYAGTITGNTCIGTSGNSRYERGGGVFIDGGEFNLCGPSADISGNRLEIKNAETLDDDVYLDGDMAIGIRAKLDPATKIGLFQKTNDARAVTAGFGAAGNTAAETACFFSNAGGGQALTFTAGEVYLGQDHLPAHVHKICGESTCTHAGAAHTGDVTFVPWDDAGIGTAVDSGVHNVYLTGDEAVTDTIVVSGSGTVLNLCLNGYTLGYQNPHTTVVPVIRTQNGAQVNLCDCGSVGSVKGDDTALSANAGNNGGVVYVDGTSTFNQYGGSLTGAYAERGGGAYVKGEFNLYGGSIAGNQAGDTTRNIPGQGGGVYVDGGALAVYGGKIADNRADGIVGAINGGGVYVQSGSLTLAGGTVSGNVSYGDGGGIYANGGTLLLTGGQITGNNVGNVSARGAGVYAGASAALKVSGAPVVQGNVRNGNVYLPAGQTITVTDDLDFGADIGVLTDPLHDRIITSGYADHGGNLPKDYFGADIADNTILLWQKQQDAATREAFLAVPCTVSGTVKDSAGAPVEDTPLSFHASSETRLLGTNGDDLPFETRTDAAGRYSIVLYQGIDYGFYLTAERYYYDLTPTELTVPSGSASLELNIAAKESPCKGSMDGTLIDQKGDVLAGATVTLHSMDTVQGEMTYSTQTDADGKFHLFVLFGQYDVSVTKPGYTVTIDDPRYQTTNISTGGHGSSLIKVTTVRNEATVSGTVTDADGYDMKDARVTFTGTPPFYGYLTSFGGTVNSNGAYTATGAEGTYTVKVTKPGCTIQVTDGGKLSFISGAVTHDIKVETSLNTGTVSGRVTDTDGSPDSMEGATVTLSGTTTADGGRRSFRAVAGADGSYSVTVPEGTGYTAMVTKPGYTVGISSGGGSFDVAGDTAKDFDVQAALNKGTVRGLLKDNGARITDDVTMTLTGTSVADGRQYTFNAAFTPVFGEDGQQKSHEYNYTVTDVPEGTYHIAVAQTNLDIVVMVPYDGTISVTNGDVTEDIEVNSSYAKGTVSGTVTDGGTPLAGATVKLTGMSFGFDRTFRTTTDAHGAYSVTVPRDQEGKGGYTITVEKPGYTITVNSGSPVSVIEGTVAKDVIADLTVTATQNEGTVSGSVTGVGAALAEGATVKLTGTSIYDGNAKSFTGTVADGAYAVEHVPEGTYEVTLEKSGLAIMVSGGGVVSVQNGNVANDVEIAVSLNIGTLSGTVTGGGTPLAGATVVLSGNSTVDGKERTFRAQTDDSGNYSVNALEGSAYLVTMEKPGYTVTVNSGSPVAVASGPQTHNITVSAARNEGTVSGSVTDQNTPPVSMDGATVKLSGTSVAEGEKTFTGTVTAGSYTISEMVPEGTYTVTVKKPGYDCDMVTGGTVTMTNGNQTNDIEVLASLGSGLVHGIVKDDSGTLMAGARVTLSGASAYDGKEKTFTGTVGSDGLYSIEALDGTYTASVTWPGHTVGAISPGGTVTVDGDSVTHDITATVTRNEGTISGTVTEQSGISMDGATVTLTGALTGEEYTAGISGGSYSVTVPTGLYHISVQKAGYVLTLVSSDTVLAVKDAPREKNIEVKAVLLTYEVAGKVTETNGLSMAGAALAFTNQFDESAVTTAVLAQDGSYVVRLAPGEYAVTVIKPGYNVQVNGTGSVTVGQADIGGCDLSVTAAALERVPGGKLDANEDGEVTEAELAAALGSSAELSGSKGAQVVTLNENVALSASLVVNVGRLKLQLGGYTLFGPASAPAVVFEEKTVSVFASGVGGTYGGDGASAMQCESGALAIISGGTHMGGSGAPGARIFGSLLLQDDAAIYGSAGQAGIEGPGGNVFVRSATVFGGDGAPGGTGISSMQKVTLSSGALVLGGAGTDDPDAAGGDGGCALSGIQTVVMAGGTAGGGRGGDGWSMGGSGGNALSSDVAALEANGRGLVIGGDGGDSFTTPGRGGKGNPNGFARYDVRVFDGSDGTVPGAPVITAQPQNQAALVGGTAKFQVQANSSLALTYQWQENRGNGFVDLSGATAESYTTPALALADDGTRYRCIVSNAKGKTTSDEALLTVKQNAYNMLEGADSEWNPAGGNGLTVRVDAPFEKFTGVSVDDIALAPDYYTARSGSTIVTVKPEYLRTLAPGKHTLRIEFTDGYAKTAFTVLAAQGNTAATGTAKTGDTAMPIWVWIIIAIAAVGVLAVVVLLRKRGRK